MFRKIWLSFKSIKNLHILVFDLLGLIKGDVTYYLWNGLEFTARAGTSDVSEIIINNADSEYPSYFFPKNYNPVIIDAGANIGDTTLFIYQKLKSNKPIIHALEPNSDSYTYLLKNLKLNNVKGVIPHKVALIDKNGKERLNFNGNNFDGAFVKGMMKGEKTNSEIVDTSTFISFCKKNKIKHIDLLKMDIEGSEYSVFRTSKQFIKDYVKTIFVELHNINDHDNYRRFKRDVSKIGFSIEADIMNRTLFLRNKNYS
jgi:FkbM family methyltransferase